MDLLLADNWHRPAYRIRMAKITPFDHMRRTRFQNQAIAASARAGSQHHGGGQTDIPMSLGFVLTLIVLVLLTFVIAWYVPDYLKSKSLPLGLASQATHDTQSVQFGRCHYGGGTNCVVDGDTIWYRGANIRIADIDTPETHPARCAEEQRLGDAATARLQVLMNAGPFSLESIDRDTDRYGRSLRIVTRGGDSLGGVLVDEGLARWYNGGRQPWC